MYGSTTLKAAGEAELYDIRQISTMHHAALARKFVVWPLKQRCVRSSIMICLDPSSASESNRPFHFLLSGPS